MTRKRFLNYLQQVLGGGVLVLSILTLNRLLERVLNRTRWLPAAIQTEQAGWKVGKFFFLKTHNREEPLALSRRCPHLGCTVEIKQGQGEMVCPCHGSRFNLDGTFLSGPAGTDMQKLKTRKSDNGTLEVEIDVL